MNTKEKILAALNCALDDIAEDRLLDILLDAYRAKKARIAELEVANEAEREKLQYAHDALHREQIRLRHDPLYGAAGAYYFKVNGRRFGVTVVGSKIEMFERVRGVDFSAQQMSLAEWGL
jgi:hypothetical protein